MERKQVVALLAARRTNNRKVCITLLAGNRLG